jgi:hypothetical protein
VVAINRNAWSQSIVIGGRNQSVRPKRWRRAWKIALIEKLNPDWRDLTDDRYRHEAPTSRSRD